MENNNSKAVSKGWTAKNILIGTEIFVLGCFLFIADIYASFESGSPGVSLWINLIGYIAFAIILVGVLGFWLVIPAFQTWRGTKKEWIAWIFLAIVIMLVGILIYFHDLI